MRKLLTILVFVSLFSCGLKTDKNNYKNLSDYLYLPFDTAKVITMLNIDYKKELPEITNSNELFDTLDLMYIAYACDCQNWVNEREYDNYYTNTNDTDMTPFNTQKYGYYIEAANSSVEIDPEIISNLNRVKFIGRLRTEEGWPTNANFQDPDPPKGKVFTYYSYQVAFPLTVYGPPCVMDKKGNIEPTEITIRE